MTWLTMGTLASKRLFPSHGHHLMMSRMNLLWFQYSSCEMNKVFVLIPCFSRKVFFSSMLTTLWLLFLRLMGARSAEK